MPHLPLLPQVPLEHALPSVQVAPFGATQRFSCVLHRPVSHTALKPELGQVPSWSPSLGSGDPGGKRLAHVFVAPLQ